MMNIPRVQSQHLQLTGRKGRRAKEVEARSPKSQSQTSCAIIAIDLSIPNQIAGQKAEARRGKD